MQTTEQTPDPESQRCSRAVRGEFGWSPYGLGQRLAIIALISVASAGVLLVIAAPSCGCVAANRNAEVGSRNETPNATAQPTTQPAIEEKQTGVESHSNASQTGLANVTAQGNTGIAMTTTVGLGIVVIFTVMMTAFFVFLTIQEFLSHRREMARISKQPNPPQVVQLDASEIQDGGSRPTLRGNA